MISAVNYTEDAPPREAEHSKMMFLDVVQVVHVYSIMLSPKSYSVSHEWRLLHGGYGWTTADTCVNESSKCTKFIKQLLKHVLS